MRKIKLALLTAAMISTIVGSALIVSLRTSTAAPTPTLFTYTASYVCNIPSSKVTSAFSPANAEMLGLEPGEYRTAINIHNPSNTTAITVEMTFTDSFPFGTGGLRGTKVTTTLNAPLLAVGQSITCDAILFRFVNDVGGFDKGFLTITTTISTLQVVAEYSQLTFNSTLPPFTPIGSALQVVKIPAESFTP